MDNQENGISLGQLLTVFKKSLVRGIIYVLISVLIASAILIMLKTFSSINVYESSVSFSNTKTTNLSSMNLNKANAVNKALVADGKSLDISDAVIKNLTVSAIIPEDNEKDSSFIPTSFVVSLKSSSDIKLSSGEYKSLVDNIAKEYVNQFATSSMPELSATINVNSQIALGAEYLQIAYYLTDIIDDYLSNLNSFAASNPAATAFTSEAGKTVTEIISDFELIKKIVDNLKSSIVYNKYGLGNLNVYLSAAHVSANAEVAERQKIYEAAVASMEAYKSTVEAITKDNNGNNVYMFDDSAFVSLSEQAATAAKQLGAAQKKQAEIVEFKTAVGDETGTEKAEVANELKTYGNNLSDIIVSYTALSREFNNNKTLISAAKVSKPAYSAAESFITTKILLIADVAVALIAYIVAFSQTYAIMKKKGQLN